MALVSKTFSQIITFTRASTATFFNSAGTLTSAAVDAPRFDFNPSTLAAQGLLIEESRTNLLSYSDDFGNAAWTKGGSTVSTDTTTAPSGTVVADSLIEDTSTGQHRVYRNATGTTNTNPYTLSVFAKANTRTRIYVGIAEGTTFVRQGNAVFDLSAGTVGFVSTGGGGATGGSATITAVGNGWYRCTYTLTLGGTDTTVFSDLNLVSTGTTINYTGDGTSGLFIWGAQLEAGAFPTSYIPTTTTALTRAADVASVNTLSPWYNASAGTLYAEYNIPFALTSGVSPRLAALVGAGGAAVDELPLFLSQASGRAASANAFTGAVNAGRIDASASFAANTTTKATYAYASNDRAVTTGGSSPTLSTAAYTIPTVTTLRLGQDGGGTNNINGYLRRIAYYPRRLSNAELQALTV